MSTQFAGNRQEKALADYLDGITVVQIVRELGVSRSTIYSWIRKQKSKGVIKTVPTQKEVMNLKQRLAKLQDIVVVLKEVDCTAKAPLHERLFGLDTLNCTEKIR